MFRPEFYKSNKKFKNSNCFSCVVFSVWCNRNLYENIETCILDDYTKKIQLENSFFSGKKRQEKQKKNVEKTQISFKNFEV